MRAVLERAAHEPGVHRPGWPSSETATIPARVHLADLGEPLAARARPRARRSGRRGRSPRIRARSRMNRVTAALSFTGLVLAMQATDGEAAGDAPPPSPVAIVSLYS